MCDICETSLHSVQSFKIHLTENHPEAFLESQMTALAARSARPLRRINASACPLCDYEVITSWLDLLPRRTANSKRLSMNRSRWIPMMPTSRPSASLEFKKVGKGTESFCSWLITLIKLRFCTYTKRPDPVEALVQCNTGVCAVFMRYILDTCNAKT